MRRRPGDGRLRGLAAVLACFMKMFGWPLWPEKFKMVGTRQSASSTKLSRPQKTIRLIFAPSKPVPSSGALGVRSPFKSSLPKTAFVIFARSNAHLRFEA
jgi:hypothetical protein